MNHCGYKVISADGVLGDSGKAVAVYGMNIISGGTAGVVILRDGATVGSTSVIQEVGTISVGKSIGYYVGVVFPNGCFVDIDANVTQVTLFYEQIKTA